MRGKTNLGPQDTASIKHIVTHEKLARQRDAPRLPTCYLLPASW